MAMTEEERQIRQRLKDDTKHYAAKCLKIRSKSGEIIPLHFNTAQNHIDQKLNEQLEKEGKVRALILKGRQQGCSTYVGGRFFQKTTHKKGVLAFILTHQYDATDGLFEMVNRFYDNCPSLVKPHLGTSNAKELRFDLLDSGYKLGTAGNKGVGRGFTIQLFHGSEVAFWENAAFLVAGVMQAIPNADGTEVILESTANGTGNYFHEQWQTAERGESEYIAIFVPWFWQIEYRKPVASPLVLDEEESILKEAYQLDDMQLNWRRAKIVELSTGGRDGKKLFKQEYPCNAQEAFQESNEESFIQSELVVQARKTQITDNFGALIVAVDPARFGDDSSAIVRRKGRKSYGLERHYQLDTMQLTGIVTRIIEDEKPQKVFIDVIGIGAGVVDRLIELGYGHIVVGVNSASASSSPLYLNRRAEMWGNAKAYLQDYPCQIPDDDTLQADLCNPKFKYTSHGKIQLESKEDMKKRGLKSPDSADAFVLTFAFPVAAVLEEEKTETNYMQNYIDGGALWATY